jgi:glycosyltransferase involved in cell wall biosynthesis
MKIGIITGNTGPMRSGMGNYIYLLIERLKNTQELDLSLISHKNQTIFPDLSVINPFYPIPGFSFVFWSQFVSLQKSLFSEFDIVHNPAHFPILPKLGKRYISTIHDLTPVLFPQWHPRWRSFYHRVAFPRLISNSDRIIADSYQTKKDIIGYYHVPEQKISVVHLGASDEYRPLGDKAVKSIRSKYHLESPFVLFVGNLEPRKNIPTLMGSFDQCRKKIHGVKLVIVGRKGWMYEEIFRTYNALNLKNDVIFLDYVPHEDLPALYNAAELFVYVPFYEGFGLPVLEAMQCGTPVITSNRSSLPEIVGENGIMVDPNDSSSLYQTMLHLLSDEKSRLENKTYNLLRCKQFSWEKCAEQTRQIYEEVYEGTGGK